jgi:hypothetical protein
MVSDSVLGVPHLQFLAEIQPAWMLGSVLRIVAWCLVTYPSGRTEPFICTGTVVMPEGCAEALRFAKRRNAVINHEEYLAKVTRFALQGFLSKPSHRARPIAQLEWVKPPTAGER